MYIIFNNDKYVFIKLLGFRKKNIYNILHSFVIFK